jgi:putative ABC transport system permease protein
MSAHRLLRRLLPRSFRERHGDAMQRAFDEALAQARDHGHIAVIALCLRESLDLITTSITLRARSRGAARASRSRVGVQPAPALPAALRDDVVQCARALLRRPTYTGFAAVTLALGVGATTSIYSALDAIVLHPLPFPGGERVVELWTRIGSTGLVSPAPEQIEAWRAGAGDLIESLESYTQESMTLTGVGDAAFLPAASVRPTFFAFVNADPVLGRIFTEGESRGAGARVILLGHALWTRAFGADRTVIGRPISLDGEPWTVIGVMGPAASLPTTSAMSRSVDLWRPLSDEVEPDRAVALLREGISPEMLTERMAAIDQARDLGAGEIRPSVARHVATLLGGSLRDTLWILMASVLLLLAIAGVNVANLMLARSEARRRETAVRAALGASRWRLRRQVLIEGVLLALLGGALGIGLALGGVRVIEALRPAELSLLSEMRIDGAVALFGLGVAVALGLLMAVVPALVAVGRTPSAISTSARGTARGGRSRWALVIGQVGLSFALLTACLTVLGTLARLQRLDAGFQTDDLFVADLRLPPWKYAEEDERRATFDRTMERLAAAPGISGVSLASGAPPSVGIWFGSVEVEGSPRTEETHVFHGPGVDAEYFRVLGQPILEGRSFSSEEIAQKARLFVLGQAAARRFFPDGSPVGRRIRIGSGEDWYTVVGVAQDVAMRGLGSEDGAFQIYYPLASGWAFGVRHAIFFRAEPGTGDLITPIRSLLQADEPDVLLEISPARRLLLESLARQRFASALLASFTFLALLLSAVGLYGVLSQVVQLRLPEMGVRVSLGARSTEIRRLILGSGIKASAVGIALGVGLALAGMRALSTRMFGMDAVTWTPYAAAAAVLLATALLACWIPARRAARVDPVRALRSE